MNLHIHFGLRKKAKFTDAFEHVFFAFANDCFLQLDFWIQPLVALWRNCSITGG